MHHNGVVTKGYPNLEGLRFAAAASVVLFHYQHFAYLGTHNGWVDRADQPFAGALGAFYLYGENAVQVFWLLSGFIFFANYHDAIAARTVSAREFAVRRFSRLYPLHLVTMLVVLVLQHAYRANVGDYFVYRLNGPRDVALNLAFASQWAPHREYSLNGPVWSVSVEILAYIGFFLAARYVPRTYWLAVPAPLVLAYSMLHEIRLGQALALFFLGGAAWVVSRALHGRVLAVAAVTTGVAATAMARVLVTHAREQEALAYGGRLVLYICAAALLVVLAALPQASGRSAVALTRLGDMTYSSYLTHFPIQLALVTVAAYAGRDVPWRSPWLLVAYVALVMAVSRVTYDHFELPWQRRLRRAAGTMGR